MTKNIIVDSIFLTTKIKIGHWKCESNKKKIPTEIIEHIHRQLNRLLENILCSKYSAITVFGRSYCKTTTDCIALEVEENIFSLTFSTIYSMRSINYFFFHFSTTSIFKKFNFIKFIPNKPK